MQAAVTLWAEAQLAGQTQLAVADPMTTEALRRPQARMGAPGVAGDAEIDAWWEEVLRLAVEYLAAFA
jgi:hypothetical protein